jgi:hypothetical protein
MWEEQKQHTSVFMIVLWVISAPWMIHCLKFPFRLNLYVAFNCIL